MKFIFVISILISCCVSCVNGKETRYTGSTPANCTTVRIFLGIPLSDSIDFIRWKLEITDRNYKLKCNYGISKPNTNGFMNGGKTVEFKGLTVRENNYYRLKHEDKTLNILELNNNLLHLLNEDNTLLVGGGGWSYALCNEAPVSTDQVSIMGKPALFKDSMAFVGRTPCWGIDGRRECYKLKWSIVLYADTKINQPNGCRVNGTMYDHKAKNGTWKIITGKDGRITYQLNAEGREPLYLLKLDENILTFTDEMGNLLVGDLDFSYAINRKF